ncbi:hypothetical protein BDZ97DRAFT_2078699 [Flammula alnicola]|nr:hypothetical protein BDZ97DRAFT_2078699 [Flammula alnicola]
MDCSCFRCSEPEEGSYPKPCAIVNGEPCSQCVAANALEDEIHAVEEFLSSLKAKRRPIRHRMNELHDPFSSRLPPEIVSDIFMTFLPEDVCNNYGVVESDNTATTPLRLGAVCQAWRAIAWSTPQLWTSICINLFNDNLYVAEVVRDWLSRSGQLPLYIRLYAKIIFELPFGDEPYIKLLISAVVAHSNRWVYLDMDLPKFIMMRVRCTSPMPLVLKTLKLDFPLAIFRGEERQLLPGEKLSLNAIVSPTEVVLGEFCPFQIDIGWNDLTHLNAGKVSINECFELLQKAPQMTHCTVNIYGERGDFPISQTVVQHPRLTFLDIDYEIDTGIYTFLERTSFPALKTWKHFACPSVEQELPINYIIAHIERSSCRLERMALFRCDNATIDSSELNKLLRATPSLKYLVCGHETSQGTTDPNYYDPLLKLLSASASCEQVVERETFLPHLEALDIIDHNGQQSFSWDYIPGIFGFDRDAITPFLRHESSNRRPLRFFRVGLPQNFKGPVDRDIIRLLSPLMDQGLKLEIIQDWEPRPNNLCNKYDMLQLSWLH